MNGSSEAHWEPRRARVLLRVGVQFSVAVQLTELCLEREFMVATNRRFTNALRVVALLAVVGGAAAHAAPPTSATTVDGAYVVIGKPPGAGGMDFKFGWHNNAQLPAPAVGYWIGVYDITNSRYLWANETPVIPSVPGTLTAEGADFSYRDMTPLAPGEYKVNFFVRSGPGTNAVVIELPFTVR